MAVSVFSRYSNNVITPLVGSDGVVRTTILVEPPDGPVSYNISIYTWKMEDQIDYLAYSAYGDETQWWRIADANPEILFWDNIPLGTKLRVPHA